MKEPIIDKVGKKLKKGQFVVYAGGSFHPSLRFGAIRRLNRIQRGYNNFKDVAVVVSFENGFAQTSNCNWYDRFLVISAKQVPKKQLKLLRAALKEHA